MYLRITPYIYLFCSNGRHLVESFMWRVSLKPHSEFRHTLWQRYLTFASATLCLNNHSRQKHDWYGTCGVRHAISIEQNIEYFGRLMGCAYKTSLLASRSILIARIDFYVCVIQPQQHTTNTRYCTTSLGIAQYISLKTISLLNIGATKELCRHVEMPHTKKIHIGSSKQKKSAECWVPIHEIAFSSTTLFIQQSPGNSRHILR